MTFLYYPNSNTFLILHVPPVPGLAGLLKHDGAGVLTKVADLTLLCQTQDVLRVEDGLLTETTDLM